jgi:hypothetical protein
MRVIQSIFVCAALVVGSSTALAQFVKGNEAVKVMADGSKKVETPPTAGALLAKPCPATAPGCSGGGWKMVETANGVMECTEIYARPTTCRTSTYGSEKRSRVWVVKTGSEWKHCQYPDLGKECVSIKSLPNPAVQ